MNVDLSFFDVLTELWTVLFGFFPDWFQVIMAASLAFIVAAAGIKVAKLLKDLFWPF